jgi:hypothetical protein
MTERRRRKVSDISGAKPGRKSQHDWTLIEPEVYRLLDERGGFDSRKRGWNTRTRLEEALLDFCQTQLGFEPGSAALRRKLQVWLPNWRMKQNSQQISPAE